MFSRFHIQDLLFSCHGEALQAAGHVTQALLEGCHQMSLQTQTDKNANVFYSHCKFLNCLIVKLFKQHLILMGILNYTLVLGRHPTSLP